VWWVIIGSGTSYHHDKGKEDMKIRRHERKPENRDVNNLHYWESMRSTILYMSMSFNLLESLNLMYLLFRIFVDLKQHYINYILKQHFNK
jgi:hypothetical protein